MQNFKIQLLKGIEIRAYQDKNETFFNIWDINSQIPEPGGLLVEQVVRSLHETEAFTFKGKRDVPTSHYTIYDKTEKQKVAVVDTTQFLSFLILSSVQDLNLRAYSIIFEVFEYGILSPKIRI